MAGKESWERGKEELKMAEGESWEEKESIIRNGGERVLEREGKRGKDKLGIEKRESWEKRGKEELVMVGRESREKRGRGAG